MIYDASDVCSKCGGLDIGDAWCPANRWREVDGHGVERHERHEIERIHRVCRRCHFGWSVDPLSAKEGTKP
jgi:hypothetical protein